MSKTQVTPPAAAAADPCAEILLLGHAGLAKMHMHIDATGQQMPPLQVDHPMSLRRVPVPHLRDTPLRDPDPALENTGLRHDPGVCQQKVQGHPDIP
jgi:hypothetical protein